jgi:hypothetical protein
VGKRLKLLLDDVTLFMYTNVCRGLFEKDKLLYAFMMAANIHRQVATHRPFFAVHSSYTFFGCDSHPFLSADFGHARRALCRRRNGAATWWAQA